jgi:hypothetical protein
MFAPTNRAADVAALLEEGLRDGTIDLFRSEHLSRHVSPQATKKESGSRVPHLVAQITLAIILAIALVTSVALAILPSPGHAARRPTNVDQGPLPPRCWPCAPGG